MTASWKIALQVGVVLLTGGALMLTGGVASALPGPTPPPAPDCARAGQPAELQACLQRLLTQQIGGPPVQLASLPHPCLELNLNGLRVTVGQTSPPVQCLSLPRPAR